MSIQTLCDALDLRGISAESRLLAIAFTENDHDDYMFDSSPEYYTEFLGCDLHRLGELLQELIECGYLRDFQLSAYNLRCVYSWEGTKTYWEDWFHKQGDDKGYRKAAIPPKVRKFIYERDNYTCLACGKTKNLSIDHIVPEVLGGRLEQDNLQTLCRSCNSKKGTKTIDYRKCEVGS